MLGLKNVKEEQIRIPVQSHRRILVVIVLSITVSRD